MLKFFGFFFFFVFDRKLLSFYLKNLNNNNNSELTERENDRNKNILNYFNNCRIGYENSRILFWNNTVYNNWNLLKTKLPIKLFWETEGIPNQCRSNIWLIAIGNELKLEIDTFQRFKISFDKYKMK